MNEGKYTNLNNEDYHADKSSISRSSILDFIESPYRYWANHLNPDRPVREETPALVFGSAFHALILEPELFEASYIIKPEPVLLKDVGRTCYDIYKRQLEDIECSGKTVLSQEQFKTLQIMKSQIDKHSDIKKLIEISSHEISYFWQDEGSGLLCKSRPDIIHNHLVVDLKTIINAAPYAFRNAMAERGYHIQAAMIRDAVMAIEDRKITDFLNIAIEKTYPYSIGIYLIDEKAVNIGERQYKSALLEMKKCLEEDKFPDYEIQTINLPRYILNED